VTAPRLGWLFGEHDYEIVYARLEASREVNIHAVFARPMVRGELFTFGRGDNFYDVIVAETTAVAGGGWTALCRVIDMQSI
jgi:hypothetical protein